MYFTVSRQSCQLSAPYNDGSGRTRTLVSRAMIWINSVNSHWALDRSRIYGNVSTVPYARRLTTLTTTGGGY